MNITFLIGNGFDINLGLKTRYTDFYPYYLKKHPEEMIAKFISQDNNYENWADLELGLGNMLKLVPKDKSEEFLDSKGILEECLTKYLKQQNKLFSIKDSEKAFDYFKNSLIGFYNEFNDEENVKYNKMIRTYREDVNFSFITFNYTDTLDRIIKKNQDKNRNIGTYRNDFSEILSMRVTVPLHIHGTLENSMVLGVNDESQIANESLKKDREFQNYFIKSKVLTELGERKLTKAKDIINNSNYVCLFGLSIGDTDSYWWAYLIEWLNRDKNNRLVIYTIGKNDTSFSAQQRLRNRDSKRQHMLKQAKCKKDEIIETIFGRIIVINNSKIFNIPGIVIEKEQSDSQLQLVYRDSREALPAMSKVITELAKSTSELFDGVSSAQINTQELKKDDDNDLNGIILSEDEDNGQVKDADGE